MTEKEIAEAIMETLPIIEHPEAIDECTFYGGPSIEDVIEMETALREVSREPEWLQLAVLSDAPCRLALAMKEKKLAASDLIEILSLAGVSIPAFPEKKERRAQKKDLMSLIKRAFESQEKTVNALAEGFKEAVHEALDAQMEKLMVEVVGKTLYHDALDSVTIDDLETNELKGGKHA